MTGPTSPRCPEEAVPLSALQHYVFCPRQCALIHVEGVWSENAQTAHGRQVHERVHAGGHEERGGVKTLWALPLVSREHGLAGVADVVELHGGRPVPVEYKSGRARSKLSEEVQLAGQALCLEEMFGGEVPHGFIYHVASRQRREVAFTPELRRAVLDARDGVRELLRGGPRPPPAADKRCRLCSLIDECDPFSPRDFPPGYDPFCTALEDA
ncbi:CRISPR-associated protein Cas4 [Deinococcus sp. RL]|uniref:CRISPR-associated protein Cas4 n=1 Tax=Deinococcus sp. RL TaxID=1489678 RepID=UPI0004D7E35C|nr:CRISPR-associated protein Cas4 [Deinococcus sp. RL]KEF33965.1 CRISPR-associated protein Cas4 [Deinococcus sp. RL]